MEAACKELKAQCLVSEVVYEAIELPPHLEARSVGEVELRGRAEAFQLYSVERVQPVVQPTEDATPEKAVPERLG